MKILSLKFKKLVKITQENQLRYICLLQILMDASVSESVFRGEMGDVPLVLRRKSEAVMTNVSVIEDLLLNWRIWDGCDEGVLLLMLRALASLIREDHPYQAFNVKQFQSINIVHKIFLMYRVNHLSFYFESCYDLRDMLQ